MPFFWYPITTRNDNLMCKLKWTSHHVEAGVEAQKSALTIHRDHLNDSTLAQFYTTRSIFYISLYFHAKYWSR
jgi:hypothetical protein